MIDLLNGLDWKEKYVYLLFSVYKDVRFNNVDELYEIIGMAKKVSTRIVHSLDNKNYIYWNPRNPDGKYYVLLK